MTTQRQEVRGKPHDYQPSKAEQEEHSIPRMKDRTIPSAEEFAQAVLKPVRIVKDSEG